MRIYILKKTATCTLLSSYRNTTSEFEHSKHQIIQLLFHCHGVCTPNFCSASFCSKNFNKKNHKPNMFVKILFFSPYKTLKAKPSPYTFKQSFLESDTMKIFTVFSWLKGVGRHVFIVCDWTYEKRILYPKVDWCMFH